MQQIANSYACQKTEPEFEAVKEYVETLSEKLLTLEKIGERIHKERKGSVVSFICYVCSMYLRIFQNQWVLKKFWVSTGWE